MWVDLKKYFQIIYICFMSKGVAHFGHSIFVTTVVV